MMKSFLQSMTTRVFLILFGGVLLTTLLTIGLALSERQRMIGQFRDFHAIERVAQFISSLATVPPDLRKPYLAAAAGIGMRAEFAEDANAATAATSPFAAKLEHRLSGRHAVFSTPLRPSECTLQNSRANASDRRPSERRGACEALLITLPDGERLRLTVVPPRTPPLPRTNLLAYGIPFLLSIGLLAALVARMTMRPLKQLAEAATALGENIERPPLPQRGATEIRQAAAAFNAMQARIRQHIRQRSHMLAAITHDLQTPLTRLRLRLEKVDDLALREKLVGDLSAMQSMVREGLDLARSMDSSEPMQQMDLDSLIDSVCTDAADAGQAVTFNAHINASVPARPMALRRCLTNLIDNAVKYGGFAQVTAFREAFAAVIRIRDGGPGIPEEELERVFEPFYRRENSRSRATGGTGLGLTIARNIAESHRGSIQLRNHPEGGLEATLTLPC